jgi:UDP-glucuronate 4-epimerase
MSQAVNTIDKQKILVTGAAGFIGYHVCEALLRKGHNVVGLDNLNDYYDVNLKYARLAQLGIQEQKAKVFDALVSSDTHTAAFSFIRLNLEDREALPKLFASEKFDVVCNLAAQAGVRYSIDNPNVYVDSNVVGFLNILECCRHHHIKHLVYASSSSVYGLNEKIPFSTSDKVDNPISLYAATKKSNELMAHTYSHLFKMPTTGLRFFTVYGPWGRPDMAIYLFTDAIINDKPIKVFNHGKMERDFTYIDDITEGVVRVAESDVSSGARAADLYKLYNIGNNKSEKLLDFIEEIEANIGKKADKNLMEIQAGDVERTWANVDALIKDYNYQPATDMKVGIKAFVDWYKDYHGVD